MYVILAIILIVVILVVCIYNSLIALKNNIKNKEAEIENLKKEGKPENEISAAAQAYEALIQGYNAKLKVAPASLIAKYLGFTPIGEGMPQSPLQPKSQPETSTQPETPAQSEPPKQPEPAKETFPEPGTEPPEETLIETHPQKPAEPNESNSSEPPSQENPPQ